MNLEKKLNLWESQNLISAAQKAQIYDFEKSHKKYGFFMAMVLLGLFIIALGIISIVAANWYAISASVKLVCYFIMLGGATYGIFRAWEQQKKIWFEGGLLFLFIATAAGIGLIGQTFQLSGNWEDFALFWTLLTLPLVVVCRRIVLPLFWWPLFWHSILGYLAKFDWLVDWLEKIFEKLRFLENYPAMVVVIVLCFYGLFFALFNFLYKRFNHHPVWKAAIAYTYICLYAVPIVTLMVEYSCRHFFSVFAVCVLFFGLMISLGYKQNKSGLVNSNLVALYISSIVLYFRALGGLLATGIGLITSGIVLIGSLYAFRRFMKYIKGAKNNVKN